MNTAKHIAVLDGLEVDARIKTLALMFDQIAVNHLTELLQFLRQPTVGDPSFAAELNYLCEIGLVFEPKLLSNKQKGKRQTKSKILLPEVEMFHGLDSEARSLMKRFENFDLSQEEERILFSL